MRSHKTAGGIMPGSGQTLSELEAPAVPGNAFLGGSGWLGLQCACGLVISARSMPALQRAVTDHQEPAYCTATDALLRAEDENIVD